ncbi:MAG: hypothetical protein AAB383_04075 [Patescibacteria group bacterium]
MSELRNETSQESEPHIPPFLENPDFSTAGILITVGGAIWTCFNAARVNVLDSRQNPKVNRLYPPTTKATAHSSRRAAFLNQVFVGIGLSAIGMGVRTIEALPEAKSEVTEAIQTIYLRLASEVNREAP